MVMINLSCTELHVISEEIQHSNITLKWQIKMQRKIFSVLKANCPCGLCRNVSYGYILNEMKKKYKESLKK